MSCSTTGWAYQVLTYLGDGNATQDVVTAFPLNTGTIAVWIFPYNAAGTAYATYFRSSAMAGTQVNGAGSASIAGITAFTATGFTVNFASTLNTVGKSYLCLVMRATGSLLPQGNYPGTGVNHRFIGSGATLSGGLLVVGRSWIYRSLRFAGDASLNLYADPGAVIAGAIESAPAGSFEIGTDNNVNASGLNYSYCYFPGDGNIGSAPTNGITHFKVTGTGANLAVTGLGFQPAFVMARPLLAGDGAGGINDSRWRGFCSHTGTISQITGAGQDASTGIRSIDADGFTLGTSLSQLGVDCYGFAIEGDGTCGFTCNGDIPPPPDCTDGWGQAQPDGLPYVPLLN